MYKTARGHQKFWASEKTSPANNVDLMHKDETDDSQEKDLLLATIEKTDEIIPEHAKAGITKGYVERRKDCWAVWPRESLAGTKAGAVWMVAFDGELIRIAAKGHHPSNGFSDYLDTPRWRTEPNWSTVFACKH